jgi:hypothetical protein
MADLVARRVEAIERAIRPFLAAMMAPDAQRRVADGAADFMAGNPQELALPGFVAALARLGIPIARFRQQPAELGQRVIRGTLALQVRAPSRGS